MHGDIFGWAHVGTEFELQHIAILISAARGMYRVDLVDVERVCSKCTGALGAWQKLAQFDAVKGIRLNHFLGDVSLIAFRDGVKIKWMVFLFPVSDMTFAARPLNPQRYENLLN